MLPPPTSVVKLLQVRPIQKSTPPPLKEACKRIGGWKEGRGRERVERGGWGVRPITLWQGTERQNVRRVNDPENQFFCRIITFKTLKILLFTIYSVQNVEYGPTVYVREKQLLRIHNKNNSRTYSSKSSISVLQIFGFFPLFFDNKDQRHFLKCLITK